MIWKCIWYKFISVYLEKEIKGTNGLTSYHSKTAKGIYDY